MPSDRAGRENWGIIGHESAVESLDRAVSAGRVPHALLLTGPHGIGKTTLARALARRVLCTGDNPPCGNCTACVKSVKQVSPDVRMVEGGPTGWELDKSGYPPARKNDRERRTLKIDQIRDLESWIATAPLESRYKVVVLRRFEESVEQAANAFLKTLEEPPGHLLIILTASDASLLLPTIVSRCQKLALRPLPGDRVESALVERQGVSVDQARMLARVSGGRIGWAIRAAGDPSLLSARDNALDSLDALVDEGRTERMLRAADLAKDSLVLRETLDYWLSWWRDVLLMQTQGDARVINVDRANALAVQAEALTPEQVEDALQATRTVQRQLDQNLNARLIVEVLALRLPRIAVQVPSK